MKLEKRVDRNKGIDQYVLYINHDEANAAFAVMSPLEKGMIHDLQGSERVSTILKVLAVWAMRIEEVQGVIGRPRKAEGGQRER